MESTEGESVREQQAMEDLFGRPRKPLPNSGKQVKNKGHHNRIKGNRR
jgi:hypothetical protein